MSQVPPMCEGVFEQPHGRRLHPPEAGQEARGRPPGLGRELEGGGRKRSFEEVGRGVRKERKRSSWKGGRRRTPSRGREGEEGRGGQQFEYEFIQEEEERQEEEKEKEVEALQGTRKKGPQEDLRVHWLGPQSQSAQGSHEAGKKGHEEQKQRGFGELLVQRHGREQHRGGGAASVRGDAQDQEGCNEGAGGLDGLHGIEHVQVTAHPARAADRGVRWSSAVHSPAVSQASVVPTFVTASSEGVPEHLCSHGRNTWRTSGTGIGHSGATPQEYRGPGGWTELGGFTETRTCTSRRISIGSIGGEQDSKQGVARGVEKQTGFTKDVAEGREGRLQRKTGGEQRKGQERERREGERKGGKGEGEVTSPPPMLSEQEIEEELVRVAQMAFKREGLEQNEAHYDFTRLRKPDGSEQRYNHSSDAILASTAPDGDAAPDGETTPSPLSERKKKLGAGGFRFVDIVGDLIRDLSVSFRKTVTSGEVFPLPYGSFLERPPFDDLGSEAREVLKGMIVGLNSIYDCQPSATQRVSPLHVRILKGLCKEAQSFVEKTGKFDCLSWKDFLRVRSVDYKGEEVKTAQRTSWSHVKPALPQEVGTVDLEQVVSGGCLHYVQNFRQYLVPEAAQVYTKPPKVMVSDDQWESMCEGLLSRGICGVIAESELHHVQGRPLLNGLFGVVKEETDNGQEVHRLIMNLIPLNKLCKGVEGDVSTLPAWPSMNSYFIQPTEDLLISSEDVRCFFYLFRVPREWLPFLAFSKLVPPRLCPDEHGRYYLTSLVLPMGFCNSVSLAQHIHRNVVGSALAEARLGGHRGGWEAELRRDRPMTSQNPAHRIYLDNFDQLERVDSQLADSLKGTASFLVGGLRKAYEELCIPRHPKKAVERQHQAEVQGALVDGQEGTARPRPEKVLRYVQLALMLLEGGSCSQKQMQIVAGGLVYMAMFRRPLLGSLNALWEFIQSFVASEKAFQVIPQPVRREIARFCLLVPLARMDFRLPFSNLVTASDASTSGGGITASSRLSPLGCMAANCSVRGDVVEPSDLTQVLTIGLFDGLGALRVAADVIGLPVVGHISIEKHPPARRVVESRFPQTTFVEQVEMVDEAMVQDWACRYTQVGLVILGAGPPCQGVSGLNADRRGALRDQRSCLFQYVDFSHQMLKKAFPWAQVHRLMESVASMDEEDRALMSESVGCTPYIVDPVHICGARRPRLFWPSWELVEGPGVTISSARGQGWTACQTVELVHSFDSKVFLEPGWEKVSSEPFPTFTTARPSYTPGRRPAGIQQCSSDVLQDWASDLHRYPPYQYLHKFRVQDKHGTTRLLNCEEKEVLMGFPKGYTVQCWPKQEQHTQAWQDERMTLIGNSWNVFVVAWLLSQLSWVLGVGPRLTLREVVEQCLPGGGRTLQSFLLRPHMRPPHTAPVDDNDTLLVKKIAGLTSLKGEDILLQTQSEDPVRYHRLRASIPANLWKWRTICGWKWRGAKEHINVLELRAVFTTLRWRIGKKGLLHQRYLHLVDSLVCLHSLARGRSSSRKLRRTLLRINALLLASGTQGLWAYVHTSQNPADAPSRYPVRKRWRK